MKENLPCGLTEIVSVSEDDIISNSGSITDAFATVVHDITGGNVPVDIALPLKIENTYSNNALTEPPHDKTNKMTVHPAKTHISLGNRPV